MSFPMVLDLVKGYAVVLPVPAGKTKVILYADPGATLGNIDPVVRTGAGGGPKWEVSELSPNWTTPAQWVFPAGSTHLTLTRTDAGYTVVTVDFV